MVQVQQFINFTKQQVMFFTIKKNEILNIFETNSTFSFSLSLTELLSFFFFFFLPYIYLNMQKLIFFLPKHQLILLLLISISTLLALTFMSSSLLPFSLRVRHTKLMSSYSKINVIIQ